jgi:hypothetical protein
MISQIQIEEIPYSNIIVGLLTLNEFIVFGDDVDGGGVWTN